MAHDTLATGRWAKPMVLVLFITRTVMFMKEYLKEVKQMSVAATDMLMGLSMRESGSMT